MLQLANILHSRGFSITIIHTHFNSPTISNFPHFNFHPISDGLPETERLKELRISILYLLNSNCVAPFRDCLGGLLADGEKEKEEGPLSCLITDDIWHFTQLVADGLGIPRIVLRTSSISSFLVIAALPSLWEKGYLPKQDSELESLVPELSAIKVEDLSTFTKNDSEEEEMLKLHDKMVKHIKASSSLIYNTFSELEQSAPYLLNPKNNFPSQIFQSAPFTNHFQHPQAVY